MRTLEPPFDGSHLCGVDCLKFIADAIGSKSIGSNYESLVKLTGVGMHGSSLQGLAVAAECIGMRTKTIDISNLRRLPSPLIAKVRQEHFIAVLTQDGEDIVLFDPSQGLLRVPFDDVRARFAGPALHLMECPNGAKSP